MKRKQDPIQMDQNHGILLSLSHKTRSIPRSYPTRRFCSIFFLSLEPPNLKSPFEIRVFGKEQLHRLICRREKSSPMTVSYRTHSSSGVVEINTTITPARFFR